jgi:hypothetical protein
MTKELDESNAAKILLELKEQLPQISKISNKTNKKRKKDNSSGLENRAKKKIKANQEDDDKHEDEDEDDDNDNIVFRCDRVQINKNWYNSLNKVKKYIDDNRKKPSIYNKDKKKQKLAFWIRAQLSNYNKGKYNMKDKNIYSEWTQFMKDYQQYFFNIVDNWYISLNKVKKYIDDNGKKPSVLDEDKEIKKLGRWISTQVANYNKKKYNMKDTNIRSKWTEFMKNNKKYI